jgi:GntR family transcriptional regulator
MPRPARSDGKAREVPPSRRIADELRRAILDGELAPGAKLLSERALAEKYGTARNTARQAIDFLEADGLVEAQHGRGVFVRERQPFLRLAHDRFSRRHREGGRGPFPAEAEAQGRVGRVDVLGIERVPAPAWVSERLSIGAGEQVVVRRNLYLADDEPVQLADTYLPVAIAGDSQLESEVPAAGGIYAALEELGHALASFDEQVTARMPMPAEVEALALKPGVPVIELRHTSLDEHGQAIEVTHSILPADRNALTFQLPVD